MDGLAPGQADDTDFLATLEHRAQRVTITADEHDDARGAVTVAMNARRTARTHQSESNSRMRNIVLVSTIAASLVCLGAAHALAQTTVVQNPNGGTSTVTVQTDGSGQTMVVTQNVVGGNGGAQLPAVPTQGGVISIIGPGGQGAGAAGLPLAFPPRDSAAPLPTGTSTLRGRVTAADSGRPLRRAVIRVSSGAARESRTVTTDQNGRWELKELPAGSYNVMATRSGYVGSGYGQPRMSMPARAVTVADRETRDNLDIALVPGGVIVGRVVDEFGDPVSDTMVGAQRLQYTGGVRRPVPAGAPSSSNDIGEFRLHGLQPGSYYVSVSPRSLSNPFDVPTDRVGYGQTWYPAAADFGNAQRITVRPGETVSGVVIALSPSRTARITGSVMGADGAPQRSGMVILSSQVSPVFAGTNGMIRPDGTFTMNNVAPGDYTLRATVGGTGSAPGQPPSFAVADVSVSGADVSGVVLQPMVPTTLSGRLVGDADTLSKIDPSRVRFMAMPVGLQMLPAPPQPPQPLTPELTFSTQAMPGQMSIRPLALPNLLVRAVRLDGRDVTRGFVVSPGAPIDRFEIEVVASTAKLVVTTTNARGDAVPDHDVLVFAQDENDWGVALPGHNATGRTNEQGTFETTPLLPGAYYVALTDSVPLEPGDANDPEVLAQLRSRAQRVTIGAGETATVQMRTSDR